MSSESVAQAEPIEVRPEPEPEPGALVPFLPAEAGALVLSRPAEVVVAEAAKAAAALKQVLDQKKHKVVFNGERYLEIDDWVLLGRFYGITARCDYPEYVQFGEAHGFRARAVALDASGREISAAAAYCLTDEDRWRARPKYETWIYLKAGGKVRESEAPDKGLWVWEKGNDGKSRPKKDRVAAGEEPVPTTQRASMAQTRAASKVLAQVLRFVPQLAGFKATPAEELNDATVEPNEPPAKPAPIAEPQRKSEPAAAAPREPGDEDPARGPGGRFLCLHGQPAKYVEGTNKKGELKKGYVCHLGPDDPSRCAFREVLS